MSTIQAGDVEHLIVRVLNAGVAVTGLTSGSFTLTQYLNATTPAASFTCAEIGSGWYRLAVTIPSTLGSYTLIITSGSYTVEGSRWHAKIETNDLDSLYAAQIRPIAQQAGATLLTEDQQLDVVAYSYTPIEFAVEDQNGDPVDLSGYNNWRFNVWDKTHSQTIYTLNSGITAGLGTVSWNIPENAAFFAWIAAEIAANNDTLTLYWDLKGDQAADPAKSKSVLRGRLILHRYEGSA